MSVTALPLDVRRRLRPAVSGSDHSGYAPGGSGSARSSAGNLLLTSRR